LWKKKKKKKKKLLAPNANTRRGNVHHHGSVANGHSWVLAGVQGRSEQLVEVGHDVARLSRRVGRLFALALGLSVVVVAKALGAQVVAVDGRNGKARFDLATVKAARSHNDSQEGSQKDEGQFHHCLRIFGRVGRQGQRKLEVDG